MTENEGRYIPKIFKKAKEFVLGKVRRPARNSQKAVNEAYSLIAELPKTN